MEHKESQQANTGNYNPLVVLESKEKKKEQKCKTNLARRCCSPGTFCECCLQKMRLPLLSVHSAISRPLGWSRGLDAHGACTSVVQEEDE